MLNLEMLFGKEPDKPRVFGRCEACSRALGVLVVHDVPECSPENPAFTLHDEPMYEQFFGEMNEHDKEAYTKVALEIFEKEIQDSLMETIMGAPYPMVVNAETEATLVKSVQDTIVRLVGLPRAVECEIVAVETDRESRKTSITLKVPSDLAYLFPDSPDFVGERQDREQEVAVYMEKLFSKLSELEDEPES